MLDGSQQLHYRMFFTSLVHVIPCDVCRKHLDANMKAIPIDDFLATKKDLFKWSVDLHNMVNRQLGKPEISLEAANDKWANARVLQTHVEEPSKKYNVPHMVLLAACIAGVIIGAGLHKVLSGKKLTSSYGQR